MLRKWKSMNDSRSRIISKINGIVEEAEETSLCDIAKDDE